MKEMVKMTGNEIVSFMGNANVAESINTYVAKVVKRFGVNAEFKTEVTEGREVFVKCTSTDIQMTPCVFERLWLQGYFYMEQTEVDEKADHWVKLETCLNWRWESFNGGSNGMDFTNVEITFHKYRGSNEYLLAGVNCNFYQSTNR